MAAPAAVLPLTAAPAAVLPLTAAPAAAMPLTDAQAATAAAAASVVRSFLAFDPGERRIGVATGNTLLGRAAPLRTLALAGDARFAAIAALVAEWQPDALVVGVPFHPDGAEHENTHRARRFARRLQGRFKLPVHEVDERYTTTEALSQARDGGRPGDRDADADAAALILDQHLRSLAQEVHDAEA